MAVVPVPVTVSGLQSSKDKALVADCILGIDGGYKYSQFFLFLWGLYDIPADQHTSLEQLQNFYLKDSTYSPEEALDKAQQVLDCSNNGIAAKERLEKTNNIYSDLGLSVSDLPKAYIGTLQPESSDLVDVYAVDLEYNAISNEINRILNKQSTTDINKDGQFSVLDVVELIKQLFQ